MAIAQFAFVLEVELGHVVLVEDEGRPEQDLAAVDHIELAEFTRIDRGRARLQLADGDRAHAVGRGVAEIDRVPQDHRLDAVGVDIGLHRIRSGEADNGDLATLAGLGDRFG